MTAIVDGRRDSGRDSLSGSVHDQRGARKRNRPIALRNGRPAHENAPPRLRQSHIKNPLIPLEDKRGLLSRLFGGER